MLFGEKIKIVATTTTTSNTTTAAARITAATTRIGTARATTTIYQWQQ